MTSSSRAVGIFFLFGAAAQPSPPGGTVGVWDHIQPNTGPSGANAYPGCPGAAFPCTGAVSLWPKVAFSEGAMFAAGTDSTQSARLWAFDVVKWVWYPFTQEVPSFKAADLFAFGGNVIAVGGTTEDLTQQLAYIPVTQGAGAKWTTVAFANGLSAHDGHRIVAFGGILYMIGGLTNDPKRGWEWSNAMWGLDLATYFGPTGGSPPPLSVVKLQGINAPGTFSPRGAFSINVYSGTLLLFGGLTRSPSASAATGTTICSSTNNANCVVFNDLWQYQPGVLTAPLTQCSAGACAPGPDGVPSCNCGWSPVDVGGSVVPAGRYGHAAGVLADNLYVFGGVSGVGAFLTDLWVFNIEDGFWTLAQSSFKGFSAFPTQLWEPAMAIVGHNIYVEMTGDAGGNAIYRWVPEAPPRSAGGDANGHAGTTAGLVIAILIALANLHLLVLLKFPTSVPLWLGGGARASIDGFYSAHSATANNFKAAYEAPTVIPAVE